MTNEHTLLVEFSPPINFTVANATAVEKGTLMEFEDLMTASAAEADDSIAGVLAEEKIASDGKTTAPIYIDGIFKATASGAITVGNALAASGSNLLKVATASNVGADIVGYALETVGHGETFKYRLHIGCNNNAYS